MTEIVGFVGMSHSPFATMTPPESPDAPGAAFMAATRRVAKAVAELAPDVAVVVGADHFHANFYDVMPPFVLGVEQASGFGDFGTTPGPLPVAGDLAWTVRDGLTAAGFDIALSYALTVDHGIVQSYEMAGAGGLPMVPLMVNTAAPPLPGLDRCVALGRALGDVLRAAPGRRRVLVIASGGLSHWLPSNDPRALDGDRRAAVINGRADVRSVAAVREPRVRAMGGNPDARVAESWDNWFLDRLSAGDLDGVSAIGDAQLERDAGSGGHEVRTWLVGQAAADLPLVWTDYEPVPEWITGMGAGATFAVD